LIALVWWQAPSARAIFDDLSFEWESSIDAAMCDPLYPLRHAVVLQRQFASFQSGYLARIASALSPPRPMTASFVLSQYPYGTWGKAIGALGKALDPGFPHYALTNFAKREVQRVAGPAGGDPPSFAVREEHAQREDGHVRG